MSETKRHGVAGMSWCGGVLHGSIVLKMVLGEHRWLGREGGRGLVSSRLLGVTNTPSILLLIRRTGTVRGDVELRPCHRRLREKSDWEMLDK